MTAAALPRSSGLDLLKARAVQAPLRFWCWVAFAFVAIKGLAHNLGDLAEVWGDTDDATRMVEVRGLMAGGSWFDPTITRLGFPGEGLLSHWSRLVDAPLALLVSFFHLFLPIEAAEIVVRALWPLLVLLPLIFLVARTTEQIGGRLAGLFALVFTVTSVSALIQFQVGRIDHHNVMILGAVGATLLLWTLPINPGVAVPAGIMAGLSIAVGYEGLPILGIASAIAGIWAVLEARMAASVRTYALALLGTLAMCFVATIPLSRWSDIRCDALSANLIVLASIAVIGLSMIVSHCAAWTWQRRLIALMVVGVVALAAYAAMEPVCMKGPFGQIPRALYPIWVDQVTEAQTIFWFAYTSPGEGVACILFLLVGMGAHIILWRQDRAPSQLFLAVTFICAVVLAADQIKYLPYVSWLAIPPLALVVSRLKGTPSLARSTMVLAGLTLLNQSTFLVTTMAMSNALASAKLDDPKKKESAEACFKSSNVAALSALPRGLIVTDFDLGPYIAVTTDHSALAAPYHRIGQAMLETQAILEASEQDARSRLLKIGARYVVVCPGMASSVKPPRNGTEHSLLVRLRRDDVPGFLEPMALPPGTPLKAWRVRRED